MFATGRAVRDTRPPPQAPSRRGTCTRGSQACCRTCRPRCRRGRTAGPTCSRTRCWARSCSCGGCALASEPMHKTHLPLPVASTTARPTCQPLALQTCILYPLRTALQPVLPYPRGVSPRPMHAQQRRNQPATYATHTPAAGLPHALACTGTHLTHTTTPPTTTTTMSTLLSPIGSLTHHHPTFPCAQVPRRRGPLRVRPGLHAGHRARARHARGHRRQAASQRVLQPLGAGTCRTVPIPVVWLLDPTRF